MINRNSWFAMDEHFSSSLRYSTTYSPVEWGIDAAHSWECCSPSLVEQTHWLMELQKCEILSKWGK